MRQTKYERKIAFNFRFYLFSFLSGEEPLKEKKSINTSSQ